MQNRQIDRNRHKRKNNQNDNATPIKKRRSSPSNLEKSAIKKLNNSSARFYFKNKKKKLRCRRKTRGMRKQLCQLLERALTDSPSLPSINHLFKSVDHNGNPRASLIEVLRTLQLSTRVNNIHFLTQNHWKSISSFTDLFKIEEDEPGQELFIKFRPIYKPENCTVYIDNLPEGCKIEKLTRLAMCYGNVSEVTIATKKAKFIGRNERCQKTETPFITRNSGSNNNSQYRSRNNGINVGSRPHPFGFIRFVSEESVENMIQKFHLNDPTVSYRNIEINKEKPEKTPKVHHFNQFYMFQLFREIRFLRNRRRHRPYRQVVRLAKLRSRLQRLIWKEHKCRKLAYRLRLQNGRIVKKCPIKNVASTSLAKKNADVGTLPDIEKVLEVAENLPKTVKNVKRKRKLMENESFPDRNAKKLKKDDVEKKKKKRRRRKKKSKKAPGFVPGNSVNQYFEQVQVLSLKKYEELKKEYLEMIEKNKKNLPTSV